MTIIILFVVGSAIIGVLEALAKVSWPAVHGTVLAAMLVTGGIHCTPFYLPSGAFCTLEGYLLDITLFWFWFSLYYIALPLYPAYMIAKRIGNLSG